MKSRIQNRRNIQRLINITNSLQDKEQPNQIDGQLNKYKFAERN